MEPQILTQSEIRETIRTALGPHTEFELIKFEIKPASDNPLGFLGEHLRIIADVQLGHTKETKTLHFFGKQVPSKVKSHSDYAQATGAFYKEIELYKTLFDDIKNARTKKSAAKYLPEFLYARGTELMIVEDLATLGYSMVPERTVLDLDHIKVALDAIARLHAGSFIFEERYRAGNFESHSKVEDVDRETASIGDLYPNLIFETEASDVKGHPGNTFWEAGFRSQLPIVDLLPGLTPEARQTIKKKLPDALRGALQFVKPSKRFKNILIHGDLWCNNMMFLYENGKVKKAVIVDFQLARYGPPAHDLLMFLYLVQTRSFRKEHEAEILDYYYKKLAEELHDEGLDISKLYPPSEFDQSIDYFREYAILNNIMYFQLILMPGEMTKEFLSTQESFCTNYYEDRSGLVVACYEKDEICRERMKEAMEEAIEYFKWT